MSAATTSRQKWALLIGINEYPNLSSFRQLTGCVNDVNTMAQILETNFGFPAANITLLTDETEVKPDHDNILKSMDELVDRVNVDDIVVFHYAGHGSQIADREGDEPDGWDETIVPRDGARPPEPNRDITDDQIYDWIQKLTKKTPFVTLIFDCCHSGNVTRSVDAPLFPTRALERDPRPAEELPPSPMNIVSTRSAGAPEGASGWLPLGKRYVMIAGCRHDELASEYEDPESQARHGAMSWFLTRQLVNAKPGTTYRDVFERTAPSVTANSAKQHPQIEGARDRLLFDTEEIEPTTFIAVTARQDNKVELAAGSIHGMSVGSELSVYPSGTATPDSEESSPLGMLKIAEVRSVTSTASIESEASSDTPIGPGNRAFEVTHSFNDTAYRVAIVADDSENDAASQLSTAIEKSDLLATCPPDDRPDALAYLIPPRSTATESDPVPQLNDNGNSISEAVWAVVGNNGRLLMPPHAVSKSTTVKTLTDNFEKLARYRRVQEIANPDPNSQLTDKIDVVLRRMDAAGNWVAADPDPDSGEVEFEDEDRFSITITNNSSIPVYVNVLDLGVTGSIEALFEGGSKPIEADGGFLDIGVREGDYRDVYVPESYPEDEGRETFKVFATSKEADFSPLFQGSVRSTSRGDGSPLTQLLEMAMAGSPTREARVRRPKPSEDFAAISRTFTLRRKRTPTNVPGGEVGVDLGNVTIRTRGMSASARVLPVVSNRTRSIEMATDVFDELLYEERIAPAATLAIEEQRTRSMSDEPPTIEVEIADPGENVGQFVLHVDDGGIPSWHFQDSARPATRGAASRTYVVPRDEEPVNTVGTRGLLGSAASTILKVMNFPLIDPILGELGRNFAEKWEQSRRPYGARLITSDNFQSSTPEALTSDDWQRIASGKSLLLLHNTLGRAETAVGPLPADVFRQLEQKYDGRIFALDHFTLSHAPKRNVEELLAKHLPNELSLNLDVLCHGRGGLVGRALVERLGEFNLGSRNLSVDKVVFAGSPNAGTELADPANLVKYVNTVTAILNWIPAADPATLAVKTVVSGVLTVVKTMAIGLSNSLEGLTAMAPGDTLDWLNQPSDIEGVTYFGLASDFAPAAGGLSAYAKNLVAKRVIGEKNDLLVPAESVVGENGSPLFPLEHQHVLSQAEGVSHMGYFSNPAGHQKLIEWLS